MPTGTVISVLSTAVARLGGHEAEVRPKQVDHRARGILGKRLLGGAQHRGAVVKKLAYGPVVVFNDGRSGRRHLESPC